MLTLIWASPNVWLTDAHKKGACAVHYCWLRINVVERIIPSCLKIADVHHLQPFYCRHSPSQFTDLYARQNCPGPDFNLFFSQLKIQHQKPITCASSLASLNDQSVPHCGNPGSPQQVRPSRQRWRRWSCCGISSSVVNQSHVGLFVRFSLVHGFLTRRSAKLLCKYRPISTRMLLDTISPNTATNHPSKRMLCKWFSY
jgi:hypothetical protein